MTTRVHKSRKHDVYVGRPSKWGNPFVRGKHGNRDQVCDLYREWLSSNTKLLNDLEELVGRTIACHCRESERCHGDTLIEFAERLCGQPKLF